MVDFESLLGALGRYRVEFIIVGGVAATVHGSARLTQDLDVVYRRTPANITALVNALRPFDPYLRGAPPGLPFRFDEATVRYGLNFTLTTSLGPIDLFGEIAGGGNYEALESRTIEVSPFGVRCLCLDLATLLVAKRAAGRPKDLETVAEIEAILHAKKD